MNRRFLLGLIFMLFGLISVTARASDTAVVLMYHRFGEDQYPETNIRTEQFQAQLELLKREGFSVIPLSDLLSALTDKKPLPQNTVVITVDDAYRSVYEVAYPRLRKHGFPFTVFVATDGVDKGFPAYMTWDQMREMEANGATFANHGASHLSMIEGLKGESDEDRISRVLADVELGRRRLAEELQPIPDVFAYPYGEFDGKVAERLQKMGYICFGQHSGAVGPASDRRALSRFPVAEAYANLEEFRVKVRSLPMPVVAVTPWEPVVSDKLPAIEVTLAEVDARLTGLSCFVGGQGRVRIRWIEAGKRFSVAPQQPLKSGRQRVNCTVPSNDGRYFWFSHPWFVK